MKKFCMSLAVVSFLFVAQAQASVGVVAPTSPIKIVDVTVPGTGRPTTPTEVKKPSTRVEATDESEDDVIKIETKLKVVPVVARKGRSGVDGLRAENFEVYGKNGKVDIEFFNSKSEEWRLDVEVVADLSGSLEKEGPYIRRAIEDIRKELDPNKDVISLRTFGGYDGSPVLRSLYPNAKIQLPAATPKLKVRKDGAAKDITNENAGIVPVKHVQIFLSDFADTDIWSYDGSCTSGCMNRYVAEMRSKISRYDEGEVAFYPVVIKNEHYTKYTSTTGESMLGSISTLASFSGGITFVGGNGQIDVRKIFDYVRDDLKATYFIGFYVEDEKERFSVRYRKASGGDPDPKKVMFY